MQLDLLLLFDGSVDAVAGQAEERARHRTESNYDTGRKTRHGALRGEFEDTEGRSAGGADTRTNSRGGSCFCFFYIFFRHVRPTTPILTPGSRNPYVGSLCASACRLGSVPVRINKSSQVYGAGERLPAPDPFIRRLAYLMDGAIPIGRWSFGLDPLIGLIPGIGDLIGAFISMVIVVRAVQAGVPRIAVARMMTNIAVDTLVGSIPVIGDAFDFGFKSNLKNLQIYEDSVYAGHTDTARHWAFFVALLGGAAAVIGFAIFGVIALVRAL